MKSTTKQQNGVQRDQKPSNDEEQRTKKKSQPNKIIVRMQIFFRSI